MSKREPHWSTPATYEECMYIRRGISHLIDLTKEGFPTGTRVYAICNMYLFTMGEVDRNGWYPFLTPLEKCKDCNRYDLMLELAQ